MTEYRVFIRCTRVRWPLVLGHLGHDALWLVNEVPLTDVGLAISRTAPSVPRLRCRQRDAYRGWIPTACSRIHIAPTKHQQHRNEVDRLGHREQTARMVNRPLVDTITVAVAECGVSSIRFVETTERREVLVRVRAPSRRVVRVD